MFCREFDTRQMRSCVNNMCVCYVHTTGNVVRIVQGGTGLDVCTENHASFRYNMVPFCHPSNKLVVIQGIKHLRGLGQDSIFPVFLSPMNCMLHHFNRFLFFRTFFPSPFATPVPTCTSTARSTIAVRCDRLRTFCSTQLGKNGSQIITSL